MMIVERRMMIGGRDDDDVYRSGGRRPTRVDARWMDVMKWMKHVRQAETDTSDNRKDQL